MQERDRKSGKTKRRMPPTNLDDDFSRLRAWVEQEEFGKKVPLRVSTGEIEVIDCSCNCYCGTVGHRSFLSSQTFEIETEGFLTPLINLLVKISFVPCIFAFVILKINLVLN